MSLDPVLLARDLIRKPSVTPIDAGAMDVLQSRLDAMGFGRDSDWRDLVADAIGVALAFAVAGIARWIMARSTRHG